MAERIRKFRRNLIAVLYFHQLNLVDSCFSQNQPKIANELNLLQGFMQNLCLISLVSHI